MTHSYILQVLCSHKCMHTYNPWFAERSQSGFKISADGLDFTHKSAIVPSNGPDSLGLGS